MPTVDLIAYKKRLQEGLDFYRKKMDESKSLHRQRQIDISFLRSCVENIWDVAILEREIRLYLDNLITKRTAYSLFFFRSKDSQLRDIMYAIIDSERQNYYLHINTVNNQALSLQISRLAVQLSQIECKNDSVSGDNEDSSLLLL